MKKKILFLLNILFFHINIIGGETKTISLLNFIKDINIKNYIYYYFSTTTDNLQDINNFTQTCKKLNKYSLDRLLCPTHNHENPKNHQCSSVVLSKLQKDSNRCTYILHCLANRKNTIKPYEFNNPSEKNLFFMIYNLDSHKRGILIQEIHSALDIEEISYQTKRKYYQYTKENTINLLLKTIEQKKITRFKQILQSPNQYVKQIFTTINEDLSNIINNIISTFKDITEFREIIKFLLKNINNTNTTDQHHIWQEIVLGIYKNAIKTNTKNELKNFLLSEEFNYLNPRFSADFYIKENGFLSFCNEADFNLISQYCQDNALFESKQIKCLNSICTKKDFELSINIITWLISKNINFRHIDSKELLNAYKSNNINLVKLLLNQGVYYGSLLFKICKKNNIELAQWILDNCNNNNKFIYNDNFIYAACYSLNINIVQLLFDKKISIDFYKEYGIRTTLFQILLTHGFDHHNKKYNDACCHIIQLFLDNGFDVTKIWQSRGAMNESYVYHIQKNQCLAQFLEHPNVKKHIGNTKKLEQSVKNIFSKILSYITTDNIKFYIVDRIFFLIGVSIPFLLVYCFYPQYFDYFKL